MTEYNDIIFFHLPGKCCPVDYMNALLANFIERKPDYCQENLYTAVCNRMINKLSICYIPAIEKIIENYVTKNTCFPYWEHVEFQVAAFFEHSKSVFLDDEKKAYLKDLLSKYQDLVKTDSSIINKEGIKDIKLAFGSDSKKICSILKLIYLQYQYEQAYSLYRGQIDNKLIIEEEKEKESLISSLNIKKEPKKKHQELNKSFLNLHPSEIGHGESPESKRAREELEQEEKEKDRQQQLKLKIKKKKKNKKKIKQLIQLATPKWKRLSLKLTQSRNLQTFRFLRFSRFQALIKIQRTVQRFLSRNKLFELVFLRWNQVSVKVSQIRFLKELNSLRDFRSHNLIKIQSLLRSYRSIESFKKHKNRNDKSVVIQGSFMRYYYSQKWCKIKKHCSQIQSVVRMWKQKEKYRSRLKVEVCQPCHSLPMCRYVLQRQICPWGENCRYPHSQKDLKLSPKTIKDIDSTTECWFGRGCTKRGCPYAHPSGRLAFQLSAK